MRIEWIILLNHPKLLISPLACTNKAVFLLLRFFFFCKNEHVMKSPTLWYLLLCNDGVNCNCNFHHPFPFITHWCPYAVLLRWPSRTKISSKHHQPTISRSPKCIISKVDQPLSYIRYSFSIQCSLVSTLLLVFLPKGKRYLQRKRLVAKLGLKIRWNPYC